MVLHGNQMVRVLTLKCEEYGFEPHLRQLLRRDLHQVLHLQLLSVIN